MKLSSRAGNIESTEASAQFWTSVKQLKLLHHYCGLIYGAPLQLVTYDVVHVLIVPGARERRSLWAPDCTDKLIYDGCGLFITKCIHLWKDVNLAIVFYKNIINHLFQMHSNNLVTDYL